MPWWSEQRFWSQLCDGQHWGTSQLCLQGELLLPPSSSSSSPASASASAWCWPYEPGEPPPNGTLAWVLHQPAWLPVLHWQLCPNWWEVIKDYSDDAKSMKMMKSTACEEKRERYTRSTADSASKPKSSQIRSTNQTFPGGARFTLVMMEMLIDNKCFSCVVRPGEVYKHTVVYKVGAK